MRFVTYLRVSTDKQGKSGLGLEAQQEAGPVRLSAPDVRRSQSSFWVI